MRDPTKGRLEGEVLSGIFAYLSLRGDMAVWRLNNGGFKPRPGQFILFGVKGAADLICVQAPTGRFVGVETKREDGGSLSKAQREWGARLEKYGGKYIVARSIDEVRAALGEPTVRVPLTGGATCRS